jgi:hypothetical protein
MSNSIMYQEDGYVVLETNQEEQILTAEELQAKLKLILQNSPDRLPRDLRKISSVDQQVKYLIENYCDLEMDEGEYLQWYVIRLEK